MACFAPILSAVQVVPSRPVALSRVSPKQPQKVSPTRALITPFKASYTTCKPKNIIIIIIIIIITGAGNRPVISSYFSAKTDTSASQSKGSDYCRDRIIIRATRERNRLRICTSSSIDGVLVIRFANYSYLPVCLCFFPPKRKSREKGKKRGQKQNCVGEKTLQKNVTCQRQHHKEPLDEPKTVSNK